MVEAGIVLLGSEVKSVRSGQVQLADAYAHVIGSEMWLDGMHIAPTHSLLESARTTQCVAANFFSTRNRFVE